MSNIKAYKPTTNPRRHMTEHTFEKLLQGDQKNRFLFLIGVKPEEIVRKNYGASSGWSQTEIPYHRF